MNPTLINLNSIITQNHGNIVSDMDGEKVIFSVPNGKYYNLGSIGGRIWELINTPISGNDLVNLLVNEFEVQKHECEEHVEDFLQQLFTEKLITFK
jgi:hypothetical protein